MSHKHNRYTRRCLFCKGNWAVYAIQTFWRPCKRGSEPYPSPDECELSTRPTMCQQCLDSGAWTNVVIARDYAHAKELICKFGREYEGNAIRSPLLVVLNRRAAERLEASAK